jgi:diguanylate cyclase (GGDEF)-like protein/PAS domain S-box-containing protein
MSSAPPPIWRTLRARLLFASLFIEAVMLAILVSNSVRLIEEHLIRQAENRIAAIELAYKTAITVPLASRDYATLRDILEGWRSAQDIEYIAVTDRDGRLISALGWSNDTPLPTPSALRDGGATIHIAFNVDFHGLNYGQVQYGLSSAFLSDARQMLFEQSILIALLELTFTFILLLITGYWLTRNFTQLADASQKMADGDLNIRLTLRGNDEVTQVAHSFNAMASAIQARMAEMQHNEQRFRAIADYTYGWENWFGADGRLEWVNPAVKSLTGHSVASCMAMVDFPLPLVVEEDRQKIIEQQQRALAGESGEELEFRITTREGEILWVAMAWRPIYDSNGESLGYRSSIRDITAQHFAREELAYAATHDTLTSLHNRRAFEVELARQLKLEQSAQITVFYIDLDQFKLVNDTCGHTAGDHLLQHLAARMKSNFNFGFVARLGGDEFGMILSQVSSEEAQFRAQQIIDEIRGLPFIWDGHAFHLGASIGISQSSPSLNGVTELLMAADTACYAAKELGRNRAQLYRSSDQYFQQRQRDHLSINQINDALADNRLILYAQRILPLRDNLLPYAEVLVRMVDEDGEIIPPGRFLPAAERYALVPLIDRWVIEESFRQLHRWQQQGMPPIKLNINLSGVTLADPGLTLFIQEMVARYTISPQQIGFEITESSAISQIDLALAFFDFCRSQGFCLALDDFGSGLSSFGYLKKFRVESLKIDGMFVRNAHQDPDDRAVIEAIVRLSQLRNLRTVAEFVSSEEILQVVKRLGVDYAQGFVLHTPEPLVNLMCEQSLANPVTGSVER